MSGSTGNNVSNSGSDSIVLNMSEDQAAGQDAQFTVNVDGQQVGGVQTVTADHSSGQTQQFTLQGDWQPGPHDVTVSFVNNFMYPGTSGDRNLYVNSVSYDGNTVSNGTTPIYETAFYTPNNPDGTGYGNAVFQVNDTTAASGSSPSSTPGAVSVGSGPDTLVLNMAEDPYQGDAQFTVSVDGQQIGGVQTATAVVDQGQFQEFDVHGNFGGGTHTVSVDYLNDQVGGYYPNGTPGLPSGQWALDTADRNLYVMGASLNGGQPAGGAPWELSSSGSHDFTVASGSNPAATAYNSGLFATNGAAAGGGNIAIPAGSVLNDALSFVSSAGTSSASSNSSSASTDTSTSTGSTDTSSSTNSGSNGLSASSDTLSSVVSATSPTTQDVASAGSTGSTYSANDTSTTSSAGGSGGWWQHQNHAPINVPSSQS